MNLNGTGEAELYEVFSGRIEKQMPELVAAGKLPISAARVASRRMYAPKEVIDDWRFNYFHTGDGSAAGINGDALISLDDPYILDLNPKKELYEGVQVIFDGQWEYLKSQKDKVLHLTAEEVEEAKEGYIKKNNLWVPANITVGKIYEGHKKFPGLFRGEVDPREYAGFVAEKFKSDLVLRFYSNQTTKDGKPTLRSLVLYRIDYYSDVDGDDSLNDNSGRLVGVAPEAPEIVNPGVKVSTYRGYIPTLEKKVEEVTEEPEIKKPLHQKIADAWGRIFAK